MPKPPREAIETTVVNANCATRLDRVDDHAVVHQCQVRAMGGSGESGADGRCVAALPVEAEIARNVVPDARRAGVERGGSLDNGRQRLVRDLDGLGGVMRRRQGLCHNESNRIADMPDAISRERVVRRGDEIAAVPMAQAG
jgi:hypothetical protein